MVPSPPLGDVGESEDEPPHAETTKIKESAATGARNRNTIGHFALNLMVDSARKIRAGRRT